jgi:2-keto-4-pentenoate hydratase/2-oxohepta-3-ene-1,7-dioic acid hydratase in catechol pathway
MHLFASPGNFSAHIQEVADQGLAKLDASGKPPLNTAETLGFFIKASGSITGAGDPIEIPVDDYPDRRFDHEGEIAFVMSRRAQGVSEADFQHYIFGYTIVIDVTLRGGKDFAEERVQRKSFASFSPMGPCLVTADEVPDWRELNVKLWLNGQQKQDATASDMIVSIPRMLARASHVLPLEPGDVYTTGSPPGVGQIVPGDRVEVMSPQIGSMTLKVSARTW